MESAKKEDIPENEAQLQAATVEFMTFDELSDTIKDENLNMEEFIAKTLEMASTESDEEWRP